VGQVQQEFNTAFGGVPDAVQRALEGRTPNTKLVAEWLPSDVIVYRLAETGAVLWRME
jgi:hypothetical protein